MEALVEDIKQLIQNREMARGNKVNARLALCSCALFTAMPGL